MVRFYNISPETLQLAAIGEPQEKAPDKFAALARMHIAKKTLSP